MSIGSQDLLECSLKARCLSLAFPAVPARLWLGMTEISQGLSCSQFVSSPQR